MPDFLDTLARNAKKTIIDGYYIITDSSTFSSVSLKKAILENKKNSVITEIKAASPSRGTIRKALTHKKLQQQWKMAGQ